MQHFYDGQVRRYVTQLVRLFSNFSYKDGSGKIVQVPVMYGDITRQVGNILRDNSENKIPSAPRMAVYITAIEQDRTRTSDSSFTSKVHIRERAYDDDNNEYLNTQGKNYTVERIMPSPYTLSVNVDIWSTNTDQKLQIIEQILMLFNPSLEIQTTDNYVDWSSLTVVEMTNISFSNRTIPIGTESDIDVATLGFTTPIYLNMPAKVKKLGVIQTVVMSIFDETKGTIELGDSIPQLNAYNDSESLRVTTDLDKGRLEKERVITRWQDYDLNVLGNKAQLIYQGQLGYRSWTEYFDDRPDLYAAGSTQLQLRRTTLSGESAGSSVNGSVTIDVTDDTCLVINWDEDTIPTNTNLESPSGRNNRGSVDFIIDPQKYNPKVDTGDAGRRLLLLGPIGDEDNADGADAWKATNNDDLIAGANDIIEWDGNEWHIVFDASEYDDDEVPYITNLNTGVQYKWNGTEWILSFEGEYRNGSWRFIK